MTTPTPGDLSARLPGYLVKALSAMEKHHARAVIEYIAALSALPAGGGLEERHYLAAWEAARSLTHIAGMAHVGKAWKDMADAASKGVYAVFGEAVDADWHGRTPWLTTPQPSAAEELGPHPLNTCPKCKDYYMDCECSPDAAVGAQGDGEAAARAAFEQQAKGWRNAIPWDELHDDTRKLWRDFVARRAALSAAPAAGKGVDAEELRRAVAVIAVVAEKDGHDLVRRSSVLDVIDRRLAALTRQPVAGDGKWFGPDASGGYYVKRRAEEWFYARPQTMVAPDQLAAPAATPTDGGEGKA